MEIGNEPANYFATYQNIADMKNGGSSTGTLSKAQLLNMELENARNQIQILTNQLNQSVSVFFFKFNYNKF